jgi:hypothetical protein
VWCAVCGSSVVETSLCKYENLYIYEERSFFEYVASYGYDLMYNVNHNLKYVYCGVVVLTILLSGDLAKWSE